MHATPRTRLACITAAAITALQSAGVAADTVVASRTLPAGAVLSSADVEIIDADVPGAATRLDEVVGLELRATLYAGRPVRDALLGAPALVTRNQVVTLQYHRGGLAIVTEGRALGRAGVAERVRVLNLSSRETVWGVVRIDGSVSVLPR